MGFAKRAVKVLDKLRVALVVLLAGCLAYALSTAAGRTSFPETLTPARVASSDPAVLERGRYLVYGPAHSIRRPATPVASTRATS